MQRTKVTEECSCNRAEALAEGMSGMCERWYRHKSDKMLCGGAILGFRLGSLCTRGVR
jgi:hypothetical protein